MSWNVNDAEFNAVLALDTAMRYSYFIGHVTDWEEVWGLRNEAGWALVGNDDGVEAIAVWPHERYASAYATGELQDCQPASISLNDWMETWLPNMAKDGTHVAAFVLPGGKGPIISAEVHLTDLTDECEKYG